MKKLLSVFCLLLLVVGCGEEDRSSNLGPIVSLSLEAANTSLPADGSTRTSVRATVVNNEGDPIPGKTVTFTTSAGSFSGTSGAMTTNKNTDGDGIAEVFFVPPSSLPPAFANVVASVEGFNQTVRIDLTSSAADAEMSSITASPSALPADGTSQTTVRVLLLDESGNLVEDGTTVTLVTTAGVVDVNPQTTVSGRAEFVVTAPSSPAVATIYIREVPNLRGSLTFGADSSGRPSNILADAVDTRIYVAGVGKKETTSLHVQVLESSGVLIDESGLAPGVNNLRARFLAHPQGGEYLSGVDASGQPVDNQGAEWLYLRTTGGAATLNLQAGTLPGIVEIEVEALTEDGTPFSAPTPKAVTPQISIASGPPHGITLTKNDESLTDLEDGRYRLNGVALVSDRYGNAVPDGTVINLGFMDSIIANGNQGRTTQDSNVFQDSGAGFSSQWITRNNTQRFIQPNDRVIALSSAAEDKSRFVSAVGGDSLTVGRDYFNTRTSIEYFVGASTLGSAIWGFADEAGTEAEKGTAVVFDGRAQFYIVYPANSEYILTGCYGYAVPGDPTTYAGDPRREEEDSAQTVIIVSSSDDSATVVDLGGFCFSAQDPIRLSANPTSLSIPLDDGIQMRTVDLGVADGGLGDGIPLPFVGIRTDIDYTTRSSSAREPFTVMVSTPVVTGRSGSASPTITVNGGSPGDSATVTFSVGDATQAVTVSRPNEDSQLSAIPGRLVGNGSKTVNLNLGLPDQRISYEVGYEDSANLGYTVTVSPQEIFTNSQGKATATITVAGGVTTDDVAIVTFSYGDQTAEVEVIGSTVPPAP